MHVYYAWHAHSCAALVSEPQIEVAVVATLQLIALMFIFCSHLLHACTSQVYFSDATSVVLSEDAELMKSQLDAIEPGIYGYMYMCLL